MAGRSLEPRSETVRSRRHRMGMDHCLRTMHFAAGVPLPEAVRMASLTPARILGIEKDVGSLEVGKRADFVVLDRELNVRGVYVGGAKVA